MVDAKTKWKRTFKAMYSITGLNVFKLIFPH